MDTKPEVAEQAPATEAKAEVETPTETPAPESTPAEEPLKEETIAEILKVEEPKQNLVPEAALLNEKKGRKEAERKIKELEAQIAGGATREEVSGDIDSILNEYGLDDTNKQFFGKMVKAIEAKAEAKANEKLKGLEEKENAKKFEEVFKTHFDQAMTGFPDLDGVVNPSVIKALSIQPENANKTFRQLIEDAYGNVATGKRTIETTTPGGGKAPETVDLDRARKDDNYLKEIKKDPAMRKAYDEDLLKRLMS